ncbi:GNAT family N-acetyltransferase [Embleya sp. AB8]|uniref:GNAT family N-acetyltransferase n=1 Tax=Embleya sp. AB8 TaxID=3156304 RepID=UPI003C768D34
MADLYAEAYAERLHRRFESVAAFRQRLETHVRKPGFRLVGLMANGDIIADAYGFEVVTPETWWGDQVPDWVPEEVNGGTLFAVCEMMVRPAWRRQGHARSLHSELLAGSRTDFALLFVRKDNTSARRAYERWGYRQIGSHQPEFDAPDFDVMLLRR